MSQIIKNGTTNLEFWDSLPERAKEKLLEIRPGPNPVTQEIDGIGLVEIYLDACSEGADRGGYVQFIKFHGFVTENGRPVVMEEDFDSDWLFEGRVSILQNWNS